MKKGWNCLSFIIYGCLLSLVLFTAPAIGQEGPGDVESLISLSHEMDSPSQKTIIEMSWDVPSGYSDDTIEGYYWEFNSQSESEFDVFNDSNIQNKTIKTDKIAISEDYASQNPDDLPIYFHIAAVTLNEFFMPVIGSTKTVGPFRLDIVKPKDLKVIVPETTQTRTIMLELGATNAVEMYISNVGYGEFGVWESYRSSREWQLSEGTGSKTVYVQFKDAAGNMDQRSAGILYEEPIITYKIFAQALEHGTISPAGELTVIQGTSQTFIITPETGFVVDQMSINNDPVSVVNNVYTIPEVIADYTVTVSFKQIFHTINFSTLDEHGQITPSGIVQIAHGEEQIITITPDEGYEINSFFENNTKIPIENNTYTIPEVLKDYTFTVNFKQKQYALTIIMLDANGTMIPSKSTTILHGESQTFSISPNEGYEIDSFTINNDIKDVINNSYTINNVVSNYTVQVQFKLKEYTLSLNASSGGSITPTGIMSIQHGAMSIITVNPNEGYEIDSFTVNDEIKTIENNSYQIDSVTQNYVINVTFKKKTFTISATSGDSGQITPNNLSNVQYGDPVSIQMIPDEGYEIDTFTVNDQPQPIENNIYQINSVIQNYVLHVTFKKKIFNISASSGDGGVITPTTLSNVQYGDPASLQIIPNEGYEIDTCTVNDHIETIENNIFQINSVTQNYIIVVTFKKKTYSITATSGEGGEISPTTLTNIQHGETTSIHVIPNEGYEIDTFTVNDQNKSVENNFYPINSVTINYVIHVTFKKKTYSISTTSGTGGEITPTTQTNIQHGDPISIQVIPNEGYEIDIFTVNDKNETTDDNNKYTINSVTQDYIINVTFKKKTYKISTSSSLGGDITPTTQTNIQHGDPISIQVIPDEGYEIDIFTVNDQIKSIDNNTYQINSVTQDYIINVTFKKKTYIISTSADDGGEITPTTQLNIQHGEPVSIQVIPDEGYEIDTFTVNDLTEFIDNNIYQINSVTKDYVINVTFKKIKYNIILTSGEGGEITTTSQSNVSYGESVSIQVILNEGYEIDTFTVNEQNITIENNQYLIASVTQDYTINAIFKPIQYSVSVTFSDGGAVSPSGQLMYTHGASEVFQIQAYENYIVSEVTVNGNVQTIHDNQLIIQSINENLIIHVTFTLEEQPKGDAFPTLSALDTYIPGQSFALSLNIPYTGQIVALGVEMNLPEGWVYKSESITGNIIPMAVKFDEIDNKLGLGWYQLSGESILITYNVSIPEDSQLTQVVTGLLKYRVADQPEVAKDIEPIIITPQSVYTLDAMHEVDGGNPYIQGQPLTINNSIQYKGRLTAVGMEVMLPDGWTYHSIEGTNPPFTKPNPEATGLIEFSWVNIPDNNIDFSYTVIPETSNGTVELTAFVRYRFEDELEKTSVVEPEILSISESDIQDVLFTIDSSSEFVPNNDFVINANISYNQALSHLEMSIELPSGWVYKDMCPMINNAASITTNNELLLLSWSTIPFNSTMISLIVTPDYSPVTEVVTIQGQAIYRIDGETQNKNMTASKSINKGNIVAYHGIESHLCSNGKYVAGETLTITTSLMIADVLTYFEDDQYKQDKLTTLGYKVKLPEGWTFNKYSGGGITNSQTTDQGVDFYWINMPDSSITFEYTVNVPQGTAGKQNIQSVVLYRVGPQSQGHNYIDVLPDPLSVYGDQPNVSITTTATGPTNISPIPVTVLFTKSVNGFDETDVNVINGNIDNFSGNQAEYTFDVIPSIQDGTVRVEINEGVATDDTGQPNNAAIPLVIMYDIIPPGVKELIADVDDYTNQVPIPISIQFTELVYDVSSLDFIPSNGNIGDFSGDTMTYSFNIYPSEQGEMILSIPGGAIADKAGNLNASYSKLICTYDKDAPEIFPYEDYPITINLETPYADPGAYAIDNIDGRQELVGDISAVKTDQLGKYLVWYHATDRAGNTSNLSRTVNVVLPSEPNVTVETGSYLKGENLIVDVMMTFDTICTAVGLELTLPVGWTYIDVLHGDNTPGSIKFSQESDKIEFGWYDLNNGSIRFQFKLRVAEGDDQPKTIDGKLLYRYGKLEESEKNIEITINPISFYASHDVNPKIYQPGEEVVVSTRIQYAEDMLTYNQFTAIGLVITIPSGWEFVSASGDSVPIIDQTGVLPSSGDKGILQFAWFKIPEKEISMTYTLKVPEDSRGTKEIQGIVKYRFADGDEKTLQLMPSELSIEQSTDFDYVTAYHCAGDTTANCKSTSYSPGGTISIANTIEFKGNLTSLGYTVTLPQGWEYISHSGSFFHKAENNMIEFFGTSFNQSPIQFNYVVSIPDGETGEKNIQAKTKYRMGDNAEKEGYAIPDPLILHDPRRPLVALSTSLGVATNKTVIPISAIFSKPVTGFDSSDIILENAVLETPPLCSQDYCSQYEFSIEPKNAQIESSISISINENAAIDKDTIGSVKSDTLSIIFDPIKPSVSIDSGIDVEYTNQSSIPITVTFSEPIFNFAVDKIDATNCQLDNFINNQSSNKIFNFDIKPLNDGPVSVSIAAGAVKDKADNSNTALFEPYAYTFDSTPPVISMSEPTEITHDVRTPYSDGGATAHDAIDGKVEVIVSSDVDDNTIGKYKVRYSANDRAGNTKTEERVVNVVDRIAPEMTLIGDSVITVLKNSNYNDKGVHVVDNYDDEPIIEPKIVNINTKVLGKHEILYKATDSSGNQSIVLRIVYVIDTFSISGTVKDERTMSLGGVLVSSTYSSITTVTDVDINLTTVTDIDGNFELGPFPKTGKVYYVKFTKTGYIEKIIKFSGSITSNIVLPEIESNNYVTITGSCKTYSNDVIENVSISLENSDYPATTVSDSLGRYTITVNINAQPYQFVALKKGFVIKRFDIEEAPIVTMIQETYLRVELPTHQKAQEAKQIQLKIHANPDFSNHLYEISVSPPQYYGPKFISLNNDNYYEIIHSPYESCNMTIKADTTEDKDVNKGYSAERIIQFFAIPPLSTVQEDKLELTITSGIPAIAESPITDSKVKIEIPSDGLQGEFIPEKVEIEFKEFKDIKPEKVKIKGKVFEINAFDENGKPFGQLDKLENSEYKPLAKVNITIELDGVTEQQLKNKVYCIRHSKSLADLMDGIGEDIDPSRMTFNVNGTVTFWVTHLSAFALVIPEPGISIPRLIDPDGQQGRCFVTASSIQSYNFRSYVIWGIVMMFCFIYIARKIYRIEMTLK